MEGRIDLAKRGDRAALEELVREHYARVYRFCARRIGDDWAADATQETFVTMQRTLKNFKRASTLDTWLLGIAHNHCRNLARKKGKEFQATETWLSQLADRQSHSVIDREALKAAMAQLSDEHREVVLLHEVEELRYADIAEILGVPEGTVKSRLHHAFLNLRRWLNES